MPCELRSDALSATVHPEAGMVVSSLRAGGTELLAQREGLEAYVERGSTFGIPLLHPWANRLERLPAGDSPRVRRDGNGLPIHGLVHATPFDVVALDGTAVAGRLEFAELTAFPFPHRLDVEMRVERATLEITTVVTNTGEEPMPVCFGWHPYFELPADPVIGLAVARRALLDVRGLPTGETEAVEPTIAPLADRTFDDLFVELAAPPRFSLEGAGRRLDVAFVSGYPVAQVYRPAEATFICFEPMAAPTNGLISGDHPTIAPGRRYTARFAVSATTSR